MFDRRRHLPSVAVVVLTMGNRPTRLQAAVQSAIAQRGVDLELIVVANGVAAEDIAIGDDRVSVIASTTNLGIPGGRNYGLEQTTAPVVAFLDDDARFLDDTVLVRASELFSRRPALAAVALHIVDECGATARRHIPRVGTRRPGRSGAVTAFLGGAVVMRRSAFIEAGGYGAAYVYSMEETDLALRLIDRNWQIYYNASPAVFHPVTSPGRHPDAVARTMRNRVWLAHRMLPAPVAILYVVDWLAISIVRNRRDAPVLVRALRNGWRTRPGPRRPIGWRTVARLTRLGRPPVV